MSKKRRNKALKSKKQQLINEGDLNPRTAAGLTQGVTAQEALAHFKPTSAPSGVQMVRHMRHADIRLARGLPYAPMFAQNDMGAVWRDGATDRPQMDLSKTYTSEGMHLLREGRQCLRCDEPQPVPFPHKCDLCGYAMRDRQTMDIAMEFEGLKHLGPAKPISEYLEAQQLRVEKRKFIRKVLEGGQGRIPQEWLTDKELFPDGPPPQFR